MKRLVPSLLICDDSLIKNRKFSFYKYVGDPVNTIRVFSEKGADEAFIMDISAFRSGINFPLIEEIAANSFMPLTYAGRIKSTDVAKRIIASGIERVAIGIYSASDVELVNKLSSELGRSGVCAILNVSKKFNKYFLYDYKKKRPRFRYSLRQAINDLNDSDTGEVILVDVDHEGTREGFSLEHLVKYFQKEIPLMAYGGVGSHLEVDCLWSKGFAGVAASSLLTLRPPVDAVMISYPDFKARCKEENLTEPMFSIDRYAKINSRINYS